MSIRGIRGATTVDENSKEKILAGTQELLQVILDKNQIDTSEVASIFFSLTSDLDQAFPAEAARRLGLDQIPLLCMKELDIQGSLPLCIRFLIHYNTSKLQSEMVHVYLNEAVTLRPEYRHQS